MKPFIFLAANKEREQFICTEMKEEETLGDIEQFLREFLEMSDFTEVFYKFNQKEHKMQKGEKQ